jgi:tRNA-specific 2-thiouridylase
VSAPAGSLGAGARERVVVAMSGGVDSSVAAALLVERGAEVIGVTLSLAGAGSRCCSLADADDARRVAERLGARFYVVDYRERFRREVMEPFADSYLSGRTPIPCTTCNKSFKFDYLLERARVLGASRVASGHYARVDVDPESGLFRLRRAADAVKDQTYFLFQLDQAQLGALELPLGGLCKDEVRARARALGLATAGKAESQEICFVSDGDYARAVEAIRPDALPGRGEVVDAAGRVLGSHGGIHRFTVGQRRGLGIASQRRLYVTRIDAARNRVVVGEQDALGALRARVERVSWIAGEPPPAGARARVRVRYRHAGADACLEPLADGAALVHFDAPVPAVAPGQAAVFDAGDVVLGGGFLAEAFA